MGSIREVTKKNGEKSYHAEVRLRGFPPQRTVCRTKTKAKEWIQDTEAAIRDGRFKNQSVSRKHTVANLIYAHYSQDHLRAILEKSNHKLTKKEDISHVGVTTTCSSY